MAVGQEVYRIRRFYVQEGRRGEGGVGASGLTEPSVGTLLSLSPLTLCTHTHTHTHTQDTHNTHALISLILFPLLSLSIPLSFSLSQFWLIDSHGLLTCLFCFIVSPSLPPPLPPPLLLLDRCFLSMAAEAAP